ncbi:hypothetical protein [Stenotrophomonas maltophilia]|uniref:hypothetical protein n=1 Tax=Stenotrophomonas maltophilia TaxID=40324 RepID=UPI003733461D
MTEPLLVFVLIGACAAIAYGTAVLPRKFRELLTAIAPKPAREAQVIALAKAEIAATKRGDLLAAARFAEQQEGIHVP